MTTIYLVRHAKSERNFKDDRTRPLTADGTLDADAAAEFMNSVHIDAVYSSSYLRAISTAKYIAANNGTIINVDNRLNERKVGNLTNYDINELHHMQAKDFDFKLKGGESLNETKKRMIEAMKSILMFETGNRVALISHSTALTCLLSAWCEEGYNYDGDIILSFNDETLVDGKWDAPSVYKVIFDGMNVKSIEYLDLIDKK